LPWGGGGRRKKKIPTQVKNVPTIKVILNRGPQVPNRLKGVEPSNAKGAGIRGFLGGVWVLLNTKTKPEKWGKKNGGGLGGSWGGGVKCRENGGRRRGEVGGGGGRCQNLGKAWSRGKTTQRLGGPGQGFKGGERNPATYQREGVGWWGAKKQEGR